MTQDTSDNKEKGDIRVKVDRQGGKGGETECKGGQND